MNYSQTALFSNNILLDNVPQQPYAEPVALDDALVDEFLAELGVAPLEFNIHYPPSSEHLSTTSSLSEALGNTMPQGSDEWTGHVAINPGNTSHHPINATYAHATYAHAPELTLPFIPDYMSVGAFYPPKPVTGFLSPAFAQVLERYSPFPSHISRPPLIASASGPLPLPSLLHDTDSYGGATTQEPVPVTFNLLDPSQTAQSPWLPGDVGTSWAQDALGHLNSNPGLSSGFGNMDAAHHFFPSASPAMSSALPSAMPIAAAMHDEDGPSAVVIGKRACREPETHDNSGWEGSEGVDAEPEPMPQKKQKAARAKKAVGSSKRTQKPPVSRSPQATNVISKSVDNGARVRIVITAQGVFRRSLGGPRVSQALAGSLGGEGEGSAEGGWVKSKATRGQDKSKPAEKLYSASGPFPIQALQEDLTPKELALLMVTPDELSCGTMTTLKCKLCPRVAFATRADFQRHCSQCEVHPDMLFSCDKCGDSFARDYARHRHSTSNSKSTSQYGKCSTTTSEVIAQKRKAYHRILAGYDQDFRKWMEDGTPIGTSYAARVREEITNTSKWRTTTKEHASSGGSTE